MATLFKISEEAIKAEGYFADLSVGDAYLPIDSFASNCVDYTKVRLTYSAFVIIRFFF